MTEAMPLDEPIQEPAPAKIERFAHSGPKTRETIKSGFDAIEECSAETPRPLMREVLPAEPFPVDVLGGVLRGAAEAIHDRTQAPIAICAQSVLAASTLAVQGHADVGATHRPRPACVGLLCNGGRDRRTKIGLRPRCPLADSETRGTPPGAIRR